jgi:hypothetical protein
MDGLLDERRCELLRSVGAPILARDFGQLLNCADRCDPAPRNPPRRINPPPRHAEQRCDTDPRGQTSENENFRGAGRGTGGIGGLTNGTKDYVLR